MFNAEIKNDADEAWDCKLYFCRIPSLTSSNVKVEESLETSKFQKCDASPVMKWLPSKPWLSISSKISKHAGTSSANIASVSLK